MANLEYGEYLASIKDAKAPSDPQPMAQCARCGKIVYTGGVYSFASSMCLACLMEWIHGPLGHPDY